MTHIHAKLCACIVVCIFVYRVIHYRTRNFLGICFHGAVLALVTSPSLCKLVYVPKGTEGQEVCPLMQSLSVPRTQSDTETFCANGQRGKMLHIYVCICIYTYV